ncbi:TPA: gp53-like domain-containing protein [Salmonella enterica]
MQRIDTATAQKDKFGTGKNGFTNGNPQTGTPATDLDSAFFDSVQEEICAVIESTGVTLDAEKTDQLLTAIKVVVTQNAPTPPVTSVNGKTGAVQLNAADVNVLPADTHIPADAPVSSVNGKTGAVQLTYSDVNALPSTYVPATASLSDPGWWKDVTGTIRQRGTVTLAGGVGDVYFPVAFTQKPVVVITLTDSNLTQQQDTPFIMSVTTTGFHISHVAGVSTNYCWIAEGE